jgi:hypothetical protein
MLLARGSFEAADFGTEKLVAFIGRLSGRLSGACRRLLCARLNLAIADRPGGARACGAIVAPSAMLRAYMSRANGPEHLGNQSEDRLLKLSL